MWRRAANTEPAGHRRPGWRISKDAAPLLGAVPLALALAGERHRSVTDARPLVLDHDRPRAACDQARPAPRPRRLFGRQHLDLFDRHAHQGRGDFRTLNRISSQTFGRDQSLFYCRGVAAHAANAPFGLPGGCHGALRILTTLVEMALYQKCCTAAI